MNGVKVFLAKNWIWLVLAAAIVYFAFFYGQEETEE